jgi:hypothetical protein
VVAAYAPGSGGTYQYFYQYSTGEIYVGISDPTLPSGSFYGVPIAHPQAYFLGTYWFMDGRSSLDVSFTPYWGLVHAACRLDYDYSD